MTAMTEEKADGKLREVVNCFRARTVSDGDGVNMLRVIGTETLPMAGSIPTFRRVSFKRAFIQQYSGLSRSSASRF